MGADQCRRAYPRRLHLRMHRRNPRPENLARAAPSRLSFVLSRTHRHLPHSAANRSASLAERVFSILGYLAQKFLNARVLDPANTNNVISDDLSIEEKRVIAVAAEKCVMMRSWEQIVW